MRRSTRTSTSQASRPRPDDSLADDDNPDGPTTAAGTAAATGETVELLEATPPRGAAGRLLRSVLGSDIRRLWLAVVIVLLQQAAALAGPVFIAITINRAIPALRADDAKPHIAIAIAIAIGYACCVAAAGLLQNMFIRLSVGVGQSVITELRMRQHRCVSAVSGY